MKLLLYTACEEVDQILMLVPDDYDDDKADRVAGDVLPNMVLETSFILPDDLDKYIVGEYRPYIG